MKVISITGFQRPGHFRKLLKSLMANAIADWTIEIQLEPSRFQSDFFVIAEECLPKGAYQITVNETRLGVRANPFALLSRIFERGATLVIYLEEDILISPDVVELADWYDANGDDTTMCLSLIGGGCGSYGFISYPEWDNILFKTKAFNSLGFVLTDRNWKKHFETRWMNNEVLRSYSGSSAGGWDWTMSHYVAVTRGLFCVAPAFARATHTGREGGQYCSAQFHDLAFEDLSIAACSPSKPYTLIHMADLPAMLRRHALMWEQLIEAMVSATKCRPIDTGDGRISNAVPNISPLPHDIYENHNERQSSSAIPNPRNVHEYLNFLKLPSRLDGLRVLDISPSNGFFGIECARRGASEVISIGESSFDEAAFTAACQSLGVRNCKYVHGTVYNLDPDLVGRFDIALFLGIFHRLKYPVLALETLRGLTKVLYIDVPTLSIATSARQQVSENSDGPSFVPTQALMRVGSKNEQQQNGCWFIPTKQALENLLQMSGFLVQNHILLEGWSFVCASSLEAQS